MHKENVTKTLNLHDYTSVLYGPCILLIMHAIGYLTFKMTSIVCNLGKTQEEKLSFLSC